MNERPTSSPPKNARALKPQPVFRFLFLLVGLHFCYEAYLGVTIGRLTDSLWGYFHYMFLDPGLGFFFCWYMALRGSAGWDFLPRWMKN